MQGRVMALYMTVFVGCAPIGSLLVGWLGGALGPQWALFFSGTICTVSVLGCAFYYARRNRVAITVADHVWWPRAALEQASSGEELADAAMTADARSR